MYAITHSSIRSFLSGWIKKGEKKRRPVLASARTDPYLYLYIPKQLHTYILIIDRRGESEFSFSFTTVIHPCTALWFGFAWLGWAGWGWVGLVYDSGLAGVVLFIFPWLLTYWFIDLSIYLPNSLQYLYSNQWINPLLSIRMILFVSYLVMTDNNK